MLASRTAARPAPTVDGYPGDETALLGRLIGFFEEAETETMDARHDAERARSFRDGDQWTSEEARILRERHQPIVWVNLIGRKVDLLRGIERRGRSDPKAYPRTPIEDDRSDVATQVLRYVSDDNRFDVIRSACYDNILVEGFGGCEVTVEPEAPTRATLNASSSLAPPQQDYRVVISHLPWERLFYDPHSQHPGFEDAMYLGLVIWKDFEDAADEWPGSEDILQSTVDSSRSDTYDDKPRTAWSDAKRRRVRVVQIYWKRRDDWWTATYTHGGFLDGPQKSPYLDRHGHATCPIIMRSGRVGRDNARFGIVKDMIPLQEEANKRRSKLLHSLSVNQIIAEAGAVDDERKAQREAAKPDGYIVKNKGFEFEIHKDTAEIEGQFKLLQDTYQQMNVMGPNAAMSGKDPREQSGRAILAQQAGGQTEVEPIVDELRQWTHKVFEAVWMRCKQFWTAQKVIRITDEESNAKFVTLNQPVTLQDELGQMDPAQAQQIAQRLGLQPGDPRLMKVVRTQNNLDDIDVDIDIEEGPDTPTLQIEQFQAIMQLPPQILQQFPPEFFIKANPGLRNKDVLVKMLEAHQQATAQAAQADKAAMQAQVAAKTQLVQASAQDKQAQAAERVHGMALDHAAAQVPPPPPDAGPPANDLMQPPPPPDPVAVNQQALDAEQQQHAMAMDRAKLSLAAQQQAHAQALAAAQHGLAIQQANKPPPPAKAAQ